MNYILKNITKKFISEMNSQKKEGTIVIDARSDTESMDASGDEDSQEWESIVRTEIRTWLDTHGSKLFALEASKFNAQAAKKKNLRSVR